MASKKSRYELRFLIKDPKLLINQLKLEDRKFEPYRFTDFYYQLPGQGKRIAKIRKWGSRHKPRLQLIIVRRLAGQKKETREVIRNFKTAEAKLKALGYRKRLLIEKKKAWLVLKAGEPEIAIEFVPNLGWTGEVEFKSKNKSVKTYIKKLKSLGAFNFSAKSLLQIVLEHRPILS